MLFTCRSVHFICVQYNECLHSLLWKLLKTKAINYQGQDLDISELKKLASLPTYEEAISKLLSVMQGPIQKLMGTMKAVPNKLVRTIDAVKASKN